MEIKVSFEFNGVNVIAKGKVLNSTLVTGLDLFYPDLEERQYPRGNVLEEIEEIANELILDENCTPECLF